MSKKLVNSFNRATNPYSSGASVYYDVNRSPKGLNKSDNKLKFEFEVVDLTLPLIVLTAICLFSLCLI